MKPVFKLNRTVFSGGISPAPVRAGDSPKIGFLFTHRGVIPVIGLFCFLEILDAVMTNWAVREALVAEGNSLVANIAGDWNFVLLKIIGAGLSGLAIWIIYRYYPGVALAAAVFIVIYYGVVLTWNSGIIMTSLLLM